ncbi:tripartite tricarboxylate transporter substrate binding protein [soil metagenome]
MSRRRAVCAAAAVAFGLLASSTALAAYPDKPVTIVVPGPAGGSGDITTRIVAKELSELWHQSVIVENKPGAGGIIGAQAALTAAHDGYTLLMGNTGPNAINYSLYTKLPYAPSDMVAVMDVLVFPNVLIVKADSPIKSVADLVAASKRAPNGLSFASSGVGQTTHLSGELFKLKTGANVTHVPYKGANLGMQSVMAGDTDFMFDNYPTSEAQLRGGKVRALALTSAARIAQAPEIPTMAEAGFPGMEITGWFGLFVATGTPQDRVDAIYNAIAAVLAKPEVIERFRQLGGRPGTSTPAQFEAFVASEREQWGKAVTASGARETL